MKADDYAKLAREMLANPPLRSAIWAKTPPEDDGPADEKAIVFDVLRRLLGEVKTIADTRKANADDAILAIRLELRSRWNAICDRMDHPLFVRPAFDRFLAILDKKTKPARVRPSRRKRPQDEELDSDDAEAST